VALAGGLNTIGGVQLIFSTVTGPGDTTLSTQTGGPPPPTGLKIIGTGGQPVYYNIDTTATFSGPVTICIKYDGSQVSGPESKLKLMHDIANGFVEITTSLDTANDIICGSTTSFSAFAVMEPEAETPVGGIAGVVDSEPVPQAPGGSGGVPYAPTAAAAAAVGGVLALLGAGGWYVRRRFVR
jgi:hypothetical protein